MTSVFISGIGAHLPQRVDNDGRSLERPLSDEELRRLGVRSHYVAGNGEGVVEMAVTAAKQALMHAATDPSTVDLIILSNWTGRRYIPDLAPRLKHLLGAHDAFAFDLGCACAGFVVGLSAAAAFLHRGFHTALIVASETTSQRARPGSRSTLLYSDGAGAAVLRPAPDGIAILVDTEMMTLGEHHDLMSVNADGHVVSQISQSALTDVATEALVTVIQRLLGRHDLTLHDIDWIVPHSGTAGIQAKLRRQVGEHAERVLSNLPTVGNLSSASIPVALEHFLRIGPITAGDTVVVASVGTGFYAAAGLLRIGTG